MSPTRAPGTERYFVPATSDSKCATASGFAAKLLQATYQDIFPYNPGDVSAVVDGSGKLWVYQASPSSHGYSSAGPITWPTAPTKTSTVPDGDIAWLCLRPGSMVPAVSDFEVNAASRTPRPR